MMGRSAWPSILVVASLLFWLESAPCAAQTSPRSDASASPTAAGPGAQAAGRAATATAEPAPQEGPRTAPASPAMARRRRSRPALCRRQARAPRPQGRVSQAMPTPGTPRAGTGESPTPRANAPPRGPAASPSVTAVPPADPRVRLAGSTAITYGPPAGTQAPTPPAPAANPAPGAQPPASSSGRTLIVRAVDPSQAVDSLPPGTSALFRLKPAPMEATDFKFPINLATALRLADARPLIVAAAQASVWVAEAQLTRARVLWVPSIMTGFDYIRHDGGGPDINKGVMTVNSANFFYGGSGLWLWVNLSDTIFQPLAARQVLNARHWDIQTAKNDVLLRVADAYFRVHQYRGNYAGDLYCVERGHDLVERIAQLSRDLVPQVEVEPGEELSRRAPAARRPGAAGVARRQRRPDAGPPAGPALGGRPAGARPPPDHPGRARPHA